MGPTLRAAIIPGTDHLGELAHGGCAHRLEHGLSKVLREPHEGSVE
jgi:hypothetical protein